jgi:hypothetical protein
MCFDKKMVFNSIWRAGLFRAAVVPVVGVFCLGVAPLAAQDTCKPVFDALNKMMTVPVHIYSTSSGDAGDKTSESIFLDDKVYSNAAGKWALSPIKAKELAKQEDEGRKKTVNACKFLKDDSVNGETAGQYSMRSTGPDQKTESQMWISKSTGMPVRNEVDLSNGKGDKKSHYSVRFEYKKIEAPKL